ncbi:hypothetical protein N657DRAFT_645402 [Parathielavia appendiculata]|uniref:Uncharacterized protein n=1 Tax=Parathielavia appendiculata TaxID=2587402 RepID=A0AAN6Z3S4_9PEZI|nr:hypothetical protein N657DRAFT_645402 [Parathielavia appendiculata]
MDASPHNVGWMAVALLLGLPPENVAMQKAPGRVAVAAPTAVASFRLFHTPNFPSRIGSLRRTDPQQRYLFASALSPV